MEGSQLVPVEGTAVEGSQLVAVEGNQPAVEGMLAAAVEDTLVVGSLDLEEEGLHRETCKQKRKGAIQICRVKSYAPKN